MMATVRLYLARPKDSNYDFTRNIGLGNINLSNDLAHAIQFFNGRSVRKKDRASISAPTITPKYIEFTLNWVQGVFKDVSSTVGNNLSTYLYRQKNWNSIVKGANLFEIEII